MQSIMDLLPGETELGDQDLKGMEFVETCTRKEEASQRRTTRTLQMDLSISNKD